MNARLLRLALSIGIASALGALACSGADTGSVPSASTSGSEDGGMQASGDSGSQMQQDSGSQNNMDSGSQNNQDSGHAGDSGNHCPGCGDGGGPHDSGLPETGGNDGGGNDGGATFGSSCNTSADCPAAYPDCFNFNAKGLHCTKTCVTANDCPGGAGGLGCSGMGVCKIP
jgi:hypothetical protein